MFKFQRFIVASLFYLLVLTGDKWSTQSKSTAAVRGWRDFAVALVIKRGDIFVGVYAFEFY